MKKSIALLSLLMLGAASVNATAPEETKKDKTEKVTLKEITKGTLKLVPCFIALVGIYTAKDAVTGTLEINKDTPVGKALDKVVDGTAVAAVFGIYSKTYSEKANALIGQGTDWLMSYVV